jgi:hypothetical protein
MKTINILVDNLFVSQLGHCIINGVNTYDFNRQEEILVFQLDQMPIRADLNCAIMQMQDIYGQNGLVIGTSIKTAQLLQSLPQQNKIYYVWDLDWIRPYTIDNAEAYVTLYNNPSYQIVCRSQHHAQLLENNFKCKISEINPNCNLKQFFKMV